MPPNRRRGPRNDPGRRQQALGRGSPLAEKQHLGTLKASLSPRRTFDGSTPAAPPRRGGARGARATREGRPWTHTWVSVPGYDGRLGAPGPPRPESTDGGSPPGPGQVPQQHRQGSPPRPRAGPGAAPTRGAPQARGRSTCSTNGEAPQAQVGGCLSRSRHLASSLTCRCLPRCRPGTLEPMTSPGRSWAQAALLCSPQGPECSCGWCGTSALRTPHDPGHLPGARKVSVRFQCISPPEAISSPPISSAPCTDS